MVWILLVASSLFLSRYTSEPGGPSPLWEASAGLLKIFITQIEVHTL
jgi:hypothetical protein